MDKKQLRKDMIQKRLSLSDERFSSLNKKIQEKLETLDTFRKAKKIAIYVSYRHEADTRDLMEKHFQDKVLAVPRIENKEMNFYVIHSFDELKKGYFGVDEPVTDILMKPGDIDLIIVPLLLFDRKRNRVGYGAGFYDRYMKDLKIPKIGIAYSFQEVADTQGHALDIPLDLIITDKEII